MPYGRPPLVPPWTRKNWHVLTDSKRKYAVVQWQVSTLNRAFAGHRHMDVSSYLIELPENIARQLGVPTDWMGTKSRNLYNAYIADGYAVQGDRAAAERKPTGPRRAVVGTSQEPGPSSRPDPVTARTSSESSRGSSASPAGGESATHRSPVRSDYIGETVERQGGDTSPSTALERFRETASLDSEDEALVKTLNELESTGQLLHQEQEEVDGESKSSGHSDYSRFGQADDSTRQPEQDSEVGRGDTSSSVESDIGGSEADDVPIPTDGGRAERIVTSIRAAIREDLLCLHMCPKRVHVLIYRPEHA